MYVGMVGGKFLPPTMQISVKFRDFKELYIFVSFQQITFKLSNFTKLKALFPAYFLWLVLVKSWKNRGKVHYDKYSVNTKCDDYYKLPQYYNITVIYNNTDFVYELL